jgi:altronate hydrolase
MSNIYTQTAFPVSDYAIIVNADDNVAVVKNETSEGVSVLLPNQDTVTLSRIVPPGHRFATRDIPAGDFVFQYGQPIGTSLGIAKGDWITHENMSNDVPRTIAFSSI